jgi:SPP1 gp7 family putative phage head morphogenesis protein
MRGVPQVVAQIDATVDYIMKGGFYITVEEGLENAKEIKEIVDDFMRRMNFDTFLRTVIRSVLIYGNAYVEIVHTDVMKDLKKKITIEELKIWSAKHMYVKREENADVKYYSQWYGKGKDFVKWNPVEIAHFKFNVIGDDAYGTSLIGPLLPTIKHKLQMENSIAKIFSRKANAPIILNVGAQDGSYVPKQQDLQAIADDMAFMKDDTEWVFNQHVKASAVGFQGKVMDFKPFSEYWDMQIMYGGRVPEVILGKGSVPEGLAKVQLEIFGSRGKAIKENIEKELEDKIFRILLTSEGYADAQIEFEWGKPSDEEVRKEVDTYRDLLDQKIMVPEALRLAIAAELAKTLNVGEETVKIEKELEKKEQDDEKRRQKDLKDNPPVPPAPGQQPGQPPQQPPPPPAKPGQQPPPAPPKKPPAKKEGLNLDETIRTMPNSKRSPPLENSFFHDLKDMNEDARKRIMKLVAGFDESMKIEEKLPKKRYVELVKKIAKEMDTSYQEAEKLVGEHIKKSYMLGLETAETRLGADIGIGTFERDSLKMLQSTGLALVKDVPQEAKKRLAFEISNGILSGDGIQEIRRNMNKVFDASNARLESIARTEVSRAMTEAELNGYERSEVVERVEWATAEDERVCPICEPKDGKTYTLDEARGLIPIHPMCRCDFIPVV